MLDDVIHILTENKDLADIGPPQNNSTILQAELELGVRFPRAYREYLTRWGWLSFGPNEYLGLGTDVNDVVKRTIQARVRAKLSNNLIMICDREGDEYVCIDTGKCSEEDCQVVIWDVPTRAVSRVRSDSFEQFLASDLRDFLG